jgi:hypothetical protein
MTRGITEIVGESGSGKSQLCLQLCLQVRGLSWHVVFGFGCGVVHVVRSDR